MAAEPKPMASAEAELEAELRSWLREQRASWDAAVQSGKPASPAGSLELWEDMPALDSKMVARSSHIFRKYLGIPLDPKLIRPGGYRDEDDMIRDLIPKMEDVALKKRGRKGGK